MKKFRTVLDGLRSSVTAPTKNEMEIDETLRTEHFQVCKTVRHGFPYQPTAVAFDPVQHILAIGTKSGSLRIFGCPGVESHCRHDGDVAVIQILFLINEGALVTVCSDDTLHLWNFRQKRPEIVNTLKFQRERITHCQLPFQSKWLYIGTERGNVHVVNIESFSLSGYVINWNKAIELCRRTHPGPVVHLSDNPIDPNKLLIGFESGTVVMWDLKQKTADCRYNSPEALRSICWHHEGKQFLCSHSDGSLTTWNVKQILKPVSVMMPHAKIGKDGKPDPCKPITKVEWKSVRNGEPLVIFSGGMSYDKAGRTPSVTVMNGKSTTVLEMEHNVVDFVSLCDTPWQNDFQDPYAIVVLLQNDLVVVDLTSSGYPCFENPYPMDIHESPVTACQYYADCPHDLIPAFYSVGSKQKRSGFSEKAWPVKGGEWGTTTCSYPEIIITGHADGSLKFWDASAVTLQVLYKLKTAKTFEKPKNRNTDSADDDPFAIQMIHLCAESRILLVAGATHVILYRFSKQEVNIETPCLEVTLLYEVYDDLDSPEFEYPKPSLGAVQQQSGSLGSCSQSSNTSDCPKPENGTSVKLRTAPRKWSPGYQPCLASILTWVDGEPPGNITSISLNSSYGLMAYGNESGLAIIDFLQKTCLLNLGTPDLYGSMDPYQRAPRSPRGKRPVNLECVSQTPAFNEEVKSPTVDQFSPTPYLNGSPNQVVGSPTSKSRSQEPGLSTINERPKTRGASSYHGKAHEKLKKRRSKLSVTLPVELREGNLVVSDSEALESPDKDPLSQTWHFTSSQTAPATTSCVPTTSPAFKIPAYKTASDPFGNNNVPNTIAVPHDHPRVSEEAYINSTIRRSSSNPELSVLCDGVPPGEGPSIKAKKPSLKHRISKKFKHFKKDHDKHSDVQVNSSPSGSPQPEGSTEKLEEEVTLTENNNVKVDVNLYDNVFDVESATEATECLTDSGEHKQSVSSEKEDSTDSPKGFLRRVSSKMSVKLKSLSSKPDQEDSEAQGGELTRTKSKHKRQFKVEVVDLSDDSVKETPTVRLVNLSHFTHGRFSDKTDGSSFSRSRSSSMSSLENVTKEAIQSLVFADSYTRKTDNFTAPCLWVGTSLGSVLVIVLNLPPPGEQRLTQPVIVSPSGTIFRLKGSILTMSFLDCNGVLIPTITDQWKDIHKETPKEEKRDKDKSSRQQSVCSKPKISPSASTDVLDRQFAIIVSEKQARVMSLPSQTCAYKVKVTDTSFVLKAEVVGIRDSVCLCCYVGNGRLMAFSLPSLKPLLDINYLPCTDLRVARTFCFSSNGHALYLCSPTEIQKMSISSDISVSLNEMLGDMFLPCETPEAPKLGFFKNFFGASGSTLDREELFGENSGKASKGLAKLIPGSGGMQHLQGQAGTISGELARTRQALSERGEKLGDLDDKTAEMMAHAESFHNAAHQIMQKYRDKKWYQF